MTVPTYPPAAFAAPGGKRSPVPALLAAMSLTCLLALAAALVAQYRFDMRPCPWCILQRMIYVVIAVLCAAAALLKPAALRGMLSTLAGVLALAGAAAALWQHLVAAHSESCNLTFADKLISASGLESTLPALFQVTGTCAEAAASVAGVPFEYWSLALFALLALAAGWVVRRGS